jgi:nucleotide-binding universal stress UspA family protein
MWYDRSEDAMVATNSLVENLDTITTEDSLVQQVKNDVEKWFNTIREKSSANGINLKAGLVVNSIEVDDAIVNYAERENVDLIVMGEEEKSGLKQRMHSTTAAHVATQTKCPILIVK